MIKRFYLPLILFSSFVIYCLSIHAYRVGWFNDDAFYIIGARSLLQGRYVELNAPGDPPLVNYLPGYPVLLAPLAALFGDKFLWYQMYSILMVMGSLAGFWFLLKNESLFVRISTVTLSALNPLMVSLSGTVLSDIPYLLLSLLCFVVLKNNWDKKGLLNWVGISFLMSFLIYTRLIGLSLGLAVLAGLLWEKRWRETGICGSSQILFLLPFYLRNLLTRGVGLWHATQWTHQYSNGRTLQILGAGVWQQIPFYAHELFIRSLFRWPPNFPVFLNGATILVCAALLGAAVVKKKMGSVGKVGLIYLIIYSLALLTWEMQSTRYLFPILPFVIFGLMKGMEIISAAGRIPWRVEWGGAALALLLFFAPVRHILQASLSPAHMTLPLPEQTFAWIRNSTKPEDIFMAELDAQLYLLTNRKTLHIRNELNPEQTHAWAKQNHVSYALIMSAENILKTRSSTASVNPFPPDIINIIFGRPGFEKVFSNEKEGTAVYRVM